MIELHRVYLSIGSNIRPEFHLQKSISLLGSIGKIQAVSSAWESHAMGETNGPNFMNACLLLETAVPQTDLKEKLTQPVETTLGRQRSNDRNAPRTIDIDVILVNEEPVNLERWNYPFVVVPLAELMPDFTHPINGEKMIQVAARMRSETWIVKRPEILKSLKENLRR